MTVCVCVRSTNIVVALVPPPLPNPSMPGRRTPIETVDGKFLRNVRNRPPGYTQQHDISERFVEWGWYCSRVWGWRCHGVTAREAVKVESTDIERSLVARY
jgi:hypothetical protein